MGNVALAFLLTLIAGLSTGIGSLIAFFAKTTNKKFLAVSLGFSAGVMIYVSMVEIFAEAQHSLALSLGEKTGLLVTIIAFFGGMLFIGLIDKLIPSDTNPHEVHDAEGLAQGTTQVPGEIREREELASHAVQESDEPSLDEAHTPELSQKEGTLPGGSAQSKKLMRTGLYTALAIAIHNFPEGLATFVSALQEPSIAIPIVVAIAIHNIPEGLAVSVPIYYATGSRKKALLYSFASGLSEPVGALVGYLILMPFMNDLVFGILFAAVAGIMVFISLDELLPSARAYGEHHLSIYGLVAGMAVMAISLWLFV